MNGYGKVQYSGVTDADIRGRQMDELIRKKDALDALMAERKRLLANGQKGAEHVLTHHGYNVIDELPPVQSDVPDTNVGDMISRRAATTIPVMPKEHRRYQTNNLDDAYEQGWNDLQECIENLPSVQTEIIHCKDCKFYGRADKRRFYRGSDCLNKRIDTIVPDRDFCSRAERKGEAK